MKITFSRHAKRRARLYKIPESAILKILQGKEWHPGTYEIIENAEEGFKYPLKIVVAVEDDILTIITNYPVKKGRKGWKYITMMM